jgi:hypothetical protein
MSKQTTFPKPFAKKFADKIHKAVNTQLEVKATDIAEDAIMLSPVYSGAYVRSFSFKANNTSSRGRGQTAISEEGNRSSSPESERSTGLSNLYEDIAAIFANPDIEIKTLTLRNDSPHSKLVEDGPIKTHPNGAKVFAQIRNKHG